MSFGGHRAQRRHRHLAHPDARVQQGDRWVVNGRKVWNTNARNATHILLLARTGDRDPKKPLKTLLDLCTVIFRAVELGEEQREVS